MRTNKPHWPSRTTLSADRRSTEHLISERALRNRLQDIAEKANEPEELVKAIDAAIKESRIT